MLVSRVVSVIVSFLITCLFCPAHTTAVTHSADAATGTGKSVTRAADNRIAPKPSYSAADVVRIQMTALQRNDQTDEGIRTTYRFASPQNKQGTGPFTRFARMIKTNPYRAMLNAWKISYGEVQQHEREAAQEVNVVGSDGDKITYVFFLRRQTAAPYQDCWMTEAVIVKPDGEDYTPSTGPMRYG